MTSGSLVYVVVDIILHSTEFKTGLIQEVNIIQRTLSLDFEPIPLSWSMKLKMSVPRTQYMVRETGFFSPPSILRIFSLLTVIIIKKKKKKVYVSSVQEFWFIQSFLLCLMNMGATFGHLFFKDSSMPRKYFSAKKPVPM